MEKEEAKKILSQSVSNLIERREKITSGDLEAEVINNACLAILQNQKNKMQKGKNLEEMILGAIEGSGDSAKITKSFTDAATELFPNHYGIKEYANASIAVQQNIAWEGMWDFLRDYFQKNHGISIDEIETRPLIFYSTEHKRYENNNLVSESPDVERTINLNFINGKQEIIVSIEPSLSPKKGFIVSDEEDKLQFKGYDPDYLFTVHFDEFEEVERFILEMPNRNLKIIYFE